MAGSSIDQETRIILLGRTGSGKSATGNMILGKKAFDSISSGSSVTRKCTHSSRQRFAHNLMVVDTPGLFDTGMKNEHTMREIVKCIGMTSPGPHAVILVVGINRMTEEELNTVKQFVDHFGEGILKYMIVLFTRKDIIDYEGIPIERYVDTVPVYLKDILSRCGNRYTTFANRASGPEADLQVKGLLYIIDRMVKQNGGSYYSNDMYREAEKAVQVRMKQIAVQETMPEAKLQFEKEMKSLDAMIADTEREFRRLQTQSISTTHLRERVRQECENEEPGALRLIWTGVKKFVGGIIAAACALAPLLGLI